MININLIIDSNKIIKKIKVKGHSNFAKHGEDIVCSAVSILIYSAYLSLKNIPLINLNFKDDKRLFFFEIKDFNKEFIGELRGITIFLVTGINSLLKDYSKYIKFEIK